jgi:RNA polymerase sigma-70 factor (ECF subfamily)
VDETSPPAQAPELSERTRGPGLKRGIAGTGASHARFRSEEELIGAAASGEHAAFESLARLWWARIGKFCAASLGFDVRLAEEASQDALLGLYKALPKFRKEAAFSTFVYRICRNASIDLLRRRARDRARFVPLSQAGEDGGEEGAGRFGSALTFPGPEDEFLRKEAYRELLSAMAGLKPDERALVYLKEVEGLGLRELSAIFRIPEGTVKSRLSRIRARLASKLKEEGHARR